MLLTYRMSFVLVDTISKILTAQNARLGYVDPVTSYRLLGVLAFNLLLRVWRQADGLFTMLEARGTQISSIGREKNRFLDSVY